MTFESYTQVMPPRLAEEWGAETERVSRVGRPFLLPQRLERATATEGKNTAFVQPSLPYSLPYHGQKAIDFFYILWYNIC